MKKLPVFITLVFLLTGCGNIFKPTPLVAPSGTYPAASSVSSASLYNDNGQYTCPQKPNVTPNYDVNLDGTDYFSVCTSNQNNFDLLVHGTTEHSTTICVFPANYVSSTEIYYSPDLTTGGPLYQCTTGGGNTGALFSFSNVTYNFVFIVEQPYQAQMENCLTTQNYMQCPDYSSGQIR